jgi:pilus assembly protein Flp/PilA
MLHFEFIKSYLTAQAKTERGATLVEYALLVALIAVVCIAAVTVLGQSASAKFSDVNKNISNANP